MIEHYVSQLLHTNTALANIVDDRISLHISSAKDDFVTFKLPSHRRSLDISNEKSNNMARVQVDCYSKRNARTMANAIVDAWHGAVIPPFDQIINDSEITFYEDDTHLERITLDFAFYFSEVNL
ncbi:DUF3168 domain-containing protein [Marinibactrum halimedae]|uniref:DUF3168 domain-containing protein n=1 Tax=Marinibactrum halimedae TaxID=1444977 RepID=A0AA37TAC0_9GAMM|nr:DUF3168 domain-containing protein [Marinibactrum halimedae]MCD9458888.1 DUF3168 domain-containing protein [Marinibactrum halimedae]GLS27737.1 hypothetical protein GCM10007877_34560 [Marinibactrum halimedae]